MITPNDFVLILLSASIGLSWQQFAIIFCDQTEERKLLATQTSIASAVSIAAIALILTQSDVAKAGMALAAAFVLATLRRNFGATTLDLPLAVISLGIYVQVTT